MNKKIFPLLKSSINSLVQNKEIFFPYCVLIFVQLFVLEILYFMPRWPLVEFFGPIIRKLWSENYLHYPLNFALLPRFFQWAQIPIYILISSFCIAMAINIIGRLNNARTVKMNSVFKETVGVYVHLIAVAITSFVLVMLLFKVYELIFNRALLIRSQSGIFFFFKSSIINGAPYFNLLLSVLANTLLAYCIPIIVIEKKKFFAALILNFKTLFGSFWFTFIVIAIPSLFFVPILLLRNSLEAFSYIPEITVMALVFSIFITVMIDAVIYTALTTFYLLKKEA